MKALLNSIEFRPKTCVWEITFRCNLKCLHCASDVNNNWIRGEELNLAEAADIIRDLKQLKCEHVVLSGGEALLREDWDVIAQQIVKQDMRVSLVSNGLIIDSEKARRIKEAGVTLVALSIDGDESTHNHIRQHSALFKQVKQAAVCLAKEKVPFNIITTITKLNLHDLKTIEDTAASLGAYSWLVQLGSPLGRLGKHAELIVDPGDLPSIAAFIVAAKERNRVRINVSDTIGYYSDQEGILRKGNDRKTFNFFCGCVAGCLTMGIESNGNVKGCLSLQSDRFVEGNIRNESLVEIWRKKGNFSYTRNFKKTSLKGRCRTCKYGEFCRGGCSFVSLGASGALHSNPYCLYAVTNKGMNMNSEIIKPA